MKRGVFAHVLTYNSAGFIEGCLAALKASRFSEGDCFKIVVTDNASVDGTQELLTRVSGVEVVINQENLGFCGGNNQALAQFVAEEWEAFVTINPDLVVQPDTLMRLLTALRSRPDLGSVTPLLYRSEKDGDSYTIDAAGMLINNTLRHLDRGSGKHDATLFKAEEVFGGTGACFMCSRSYVDKLQISGLEREDDIDKIYPQLAGGRKGRVLLFDEGFFAYREDADLAVRAQLLGFGCLFVPEAIAFHRRAVLPENRQTVSPTVNRWSVRNRYLLQIQGIFNPSWQIVFWGLLVRNLLVVFGVLVAERKSLGAFRELAVLLRRSLERRKYIARAKVRPDINEWCRRGSEGTSSK